MVNLSLQNVGTKKEKKQNANNMKKYENYALGKWIKGDGDGTPLHNAITGEEIGTASSKGLDFSEMMEYARRTGGTNLRKMIGRAHV